MQSDRFSMYIAIGLISLGVLFLAVTVLPGFNMGALWPIIFFVISAGFFAPVLINESVRKELSFLCIPGVFMAALGILFTYNTLTSDWGIWAFGWLLLISGAGLGLSLAARFGEWKGGVVWVGVYMTAVSLALFALFSMLFGSRMIRSIVPMLLIISGGLLLYRSLRKPDRFAQPGQPVAPGAPEPPPADSAPDAGQG